MRDSKLKDEKEAITKITLESKKRSILGIKESNKTLWTEKEIRDESDKTDEQIRLLAEELKKRGQSL